jgi:hypothetical protein
MNTKEAPSSMKHTPAPPITLGFACVQELESRMLQLQSELEVVLQEREQAAAECGDGSRKAGASADLQRRLEQQTRCALLMRMCLEGNAKVKKQKTKLVICSNCGAASHTIGSTWRVEFLSVHGSRRTSLAMCTQSLAICTKVSGYVHKVSGYVHRVSGYVHKVSGYFTWMSLAKQPPVLQEPRSPSPYNCVLEASVRCI